MEFLTYTKELNKLAKNLQESTEIIEEEDIIRAVSYLNNIYTPYPARACPSLLSSP